MVRYRISVIVTIILLPVVLFGKNVLKETHTYAVKDGQELKMDIYQSDSASINPQPCLIFVFGGGFKGLPSYTQKPAPTLFFHGSADGIVPYDKLRVFNLGMFGSKSLAERFRLERYPYIFYSFEDIGHEVAEFPMREFLPEIEKFINDFVLDRKLLMLKSAPSATPGSYYN